MTDTISDCILYELLVYSEWKQDPEFIKFPSTNHVFNVTTPWYSVKRLLSYLRIRTVNSSHISSLLMYQLPWQFAAGENGKVVAILQDTLLEIRTSRDEYSSVIGKAVIPKDVYPQYRKLAWSPDCSMLAIAHSNGTVSFYDLLGSNLFNILSPTPQSYNDGVNALACILFLPPRLKNPKWSFELIVVDYYGNLHAYLVSPTDGFQENHTSYFGQHYSQGLWAVAYNTAHNILFLAGTPTVLSTNLLKGLGSSMGLSAWRILNDYPYYQLVLSLDEEEAIVQAQRSLWNWIPFMNTTDTRNAVFKMQISPNGRLLACLHICGSISIWHIPGIRLYKYWSLVDQPDYDAVTPQSEHVKSKTLIPNSTLEFYPTDINWWSDQEVIIARRSGAVSVCSISNLRNLLGEYPEFFAGCPQVSALYNDQGFLSLECESLLTSRRRLRSDAYSDTENSESDSDDDISLLRRSSVMIQSAIYMITDIERFQPKRKTPKLLHKTYRLLGLKSTTPEELYARKIDNEAYSEALSLARAYNLDCDLVYQRQWRSEKVSINTIHEYLSKISKRSWVLNECIQRVPETFSVARELLQFGLRETSLDLLLNLGTADDTFESLEDDKEEKEVKISLSQKVEQLLRKVSINGVTEEQEGIRYRQRLLQYFDRLCTYELILGGPHIAEEEYNSNFYEKFRCISLVTSSVEFAHEGKWQAIQHIFTYHGPILLQHWLPVLSNFPETLNPFEYRSLLPECSPSGTVFLWEQSQLRQEDWCERHEFRHLASSNELSNEGGEFLYEKDSSLKQFKCHSEELTADILSRWYINRICQIERRSGLVEHALTLVKLGKERNISGLDPLYYQLLTLDTLIYEVNIENINLSALQKLSDLEKARLLMSKTSETTFIEDLKNLLVPFLTRCEKQVSGSKKQLLRDYLVDLSLKGLTLPLKLFEYVSNEETNPIIPCIEDTISLVLDCLYAYPGTEHLDEAFLILECIPDRRFGEQSDVLSSLHDKVDELEHDLSAAEILKRNGASKPLSFIRDCKTNPAAVHQLLTKLARTLVKKVPPPSEHQWNAILKDVLELHSKVFSCISIESCFEIYVSTLLSSGIKGNIKAAADILEQRRSEKNFAKVPFDRSVALVTQAAVEYFDSAGSLLDPAMELSKACLHLILDEHPEIQEMLDLITSLHFLSDFGLSMLPLQVRLCTDRMKLVESCIHNKPKAYRNSQKLLHLAEKLRVCGSDGREREGRVMILIGETAFKAKDYSYCADICERLIEKNYAASWEMAQKLGQCDDYNNLQTRSGLIAFSLLHCPPAAIEELINSRLAIDTEILYHKVRSQVTSCCVENNVEEEEEFSDALTSPVVQQKEFPSVSSLLHVVGDSTEAVRHTTYNVLKYMGRKDFWNNTFRWKTEYIPSSEDDNIEEPFSKQGFPTFYASLSPKCHKSHLTTNYDKFSMPDNKNNVLQMCQTLLRISLLEHCAQLTDRNQLSDDSEVLLQLGEHLLSEDCCLGLAHLFALSDPIRAETCFQKLPTTSITLQLACYYYAIQGYKMARNYNPRDIYLHHPSELIDYMAEITVNEEHINVCLEHLLKYRDLLADYVQKQLLKSLDCGIDLQRFTSDQQYRQDTILGLGMTDDNEQFTLALHLGRHYNVPVSDIAAGYAVTLFLNSSSIPVSEINERLTNHDFMELLRSSPQDVCDRFSQYVYPNIDGTDHELLLLYFRILDFVSKDTSVHDFHPASHVHILKEIINGSLDIDYKSFIDPSSDLFQLLKPILTEDNILTISLLLHNIAEAANCKQRIGYGQLYCIWAEREFFQTINHHSISPDDWLLQYDKYSKYFAEMQPTDIIDFIKGICFVDKSLTLMDIDCRRNIIERARQYFNDKLKLYTEDCQSPWSAKPFGNDDDECRDLWYSCSESLNSWSKHLENITRLHLEDFEETPDFHNFKHFYRLLDLSRGDLPEVTEVIQLAVMSSLPLSYIQMLLSVTPKTLPAVVEEVLKQFLEKCISERRTNIDGDDDFCLLSTIIQRMLECTAEEKSVLRLDKDFIAAVRQHLEPLSADALLPPSVRLQAIQMLNKFELTPDDSNELLLYHHTEATIAANWPDSVIEISRNDFVSEENRKQLFNKLLKVTHQWSQIITLKSLLDKWPPFLNTINEPLLMLSERIMFFPDLDVKAGADILKEIFQENKFSEEALGNLVSFEDNTLLIFVCLISGHSLHMSKAVSLIQNHYRENDIDGPLKEEILTLILQNGLTPQLVSTSIYTQLVEHLLSGADDLPSVETVAEQLHAAGCHAEAGTLRLLHMGAPMGLATFSAALMYNSHYSNLKTEKID